jgi:hypothetical protein
MGELLAKYAPIVVDVAQDGPQNQIESKPRCVLKDVLFLQAKVLPG